MINLLHNDLPDEQFQEANIIDSIKDAGASIKDSAIKLKDDIKNQDTVAGKLDAFDKGTTKKISDKVDNAQDAYDKYLGNQIINNRSIVARAKNSICTFTVYISQTIRVNEAQIIANMFERYYTTLVQAVIAQNPIISEKEANDLVFLKKFHSNLNESAREIYSRYENIVNEYYECIDDFDKTMADSIFYTQKLTESCDVVFRVVPTEDTDLIFESHRAVQDPLTGFTYLKEDSSESTSTRIEKVYLTDKQIEEIIRSDYAVNDKNLDDKNHYKKIVNQFKNDIKNDTNHKKFKNYRYDNGRIYVISKVETTSKTTSTRDKEKDLRSLDAPMLLRDTDIKKINNLDPYSMVAEFRIKDAQGNISATVRYIIGVKTVLHPIRTQDLVEELPELITGKIKKLQKVRYKTGEISLLDYVFNIKGLKADAAKNINYNKRWINTLKRLGEYKDTYKSYLKSPVKLLTNADVPIPNGTLILSQPDVTTLTNETGIDLSIVSNAKKLAESLFLISIAIVDSSAGTIRILFPDNSSDWDIQSLASIDSEVAKTDNSQLMKELNRIVNK